LARLDESTPSAELVQQLDELVARAESVSAPPDQIALAAGILLALSIPQKQEA
jgi:hypothetical protein